MTEIFSFNKLVSRIGKPIGEFKKIRCILKEPTQDTILTFWVRLSKDNYLDIQNDIMKTGVIKSCTEAELVENLINICVDKNTFLLGFEKKDEVLTLNFRNGR